MQIGMIGLGRMGANMVRRLRKSGHACVVYDQNSVTTRKLATECGASAAASLEKLVEELEAPRAIWVMLPAGGPTDSTVRKLASLLEPGDLVIDGGNSHYKDDLRRSDDLAQAGIHYLDAGVSGGIWGLERGYCLMVGGPRESYERLEPLFSALAPEEGGRVYTGPAGSGHFVKMIHNGIEYGMMQALAEGFEILERSPYPLDLARIAETWRHGSVVSSWLLDLAASALQQDARLSAYEGSVADSGEGRWTMQAAIEMGVPAHVIAAALFVRFQSREPHGFAEKMLSAMRHGFGGHVEAGIRKGA